jgi:hypothetical protein
MAFSSPPAPLACLAASPVIAAPATPHIPSCVSHIGSQSNQAVNQNSFFGMQIVID